MPLLGKNRRGRSRGPPATVDADARADDLPESGALQRADLNDDEMLILVFGMSISLISRLEFGYGVTRTIRIIRTCLRL